MENIPLFARKQFEFYIRQWLNDDVWKQVLENRGALVIEIDQKRGKDGLLSRLEDKEEISHSLVFDFNGITTFKGFIERLLSAFIRHPEMGLQGMSNVLVDAFGEFNPSVGLNSFSREASLSFPGIEFSYERIGPVIKDCLREICSVWENRIYFTFNNTDQLFDLNDKELLQRIIGILGYLQESYPVCYLLEEAGNEERTLETLRVEKKNFIRTKLHEKESIIRYFSNFWDISETSIAYKNLNTFLELIDYDPLMAWHINNAVYIARTGDQLTFGMFREQLEHLLNINHSLYRNIFNVLTNYQKRILKAIAVTGGDKLTTKAVMERYELNTSPYVIQGLEFLRKKRLIRKYGGKHLFVDPLFRIWVLKYS